LVAISGRTRSSERRTLALADNELMACNLAADDCATQALAEESVP
jgi:hypothetical protein